MAVNRYGNPTSIYDFSPGSSGQWGDQGFAPGGSVPASISRPGMGLPGDRYRTALGLTAPSTTAPRQTGIPTWDSQQAMYVNQHDGQPFTGKLPSGQYATGGRVTGAVPPGGVPAIDPNNPAQRYSPVDIVKSPDLAAGTSDLLATFKKNADASLKGFDDYLATFKDASKAAFDKTNAATNIDPLAANLRSQQQRYAGALDTSAGDIRALNVGDANAQRAIVAQANDTLPEIDKGYQDALDRDMGAVQKNISRYKLSTGTPSSMGGAETQIQNRANADLLIPFELAKSQRKLDILQNLALPVQRDITNRETSRITQFDPMVAAQEFQSGTQTEQTIQGLKQAVSGMSWDNATRYMQSLGVPVELRQKILQGNVSTLGALGQLEDQSRYRGLQDKLGANISQPQYYSPGQPSFPPPSGGRYSNVTGSPQGANPPTQIGPNGTTTVTNPATNAALSAEVQKWASQGMSPQQALSKALAIDPGTGLPNWLLNQRYNAGWKSPYQDAPRDVVPDPYRNAPAGAVTDPFYGTDWENS